MRSNFLFTLPLLIASIVVVTVASASFVQMLIQDSSVKSTTGIEKRISSDLLEGTPANFPVVARIGRPSRLMIPKINVDVGFEYVGLTGDGAMDVPKIPTDVAWFELGPRPGEIGSAVVAGHFGWKNGIAAAFDNLYKLQRGDKLYVVDETGTTTTFVVRGLRTYGENKNASDVFTSSDGESHLNLITCEGIWDQVGKSYSNRIVIFTDKATR